MVLLRKPLLWMGGLGFYPPPPTPPTCSWVHLLRAPGQLQVWNCLVIIKAHFIFCCPFLALLWKPMSLDGFFSPALTLMGQGRCMPQGLLKTKAGEMVKEAFCFGCFVPASLWSSLLKLSIPASHPHGINSFSLLWVMFFSLYTVRTESTAASWAVLVQHVWPVAEHEAITKDLGLREQLGGRVEASWDENSF